MKTKTLRISEIRTDFQPKENLIEDRVLEYVERIKRRRRPPAIRVRFDGTNYFCEDGFHRLEAARRTGLTEIHAYVLKGTLSQMETNFREYLERLKLHLTQDR